MADELEIKTNTAKYRMLNLLDLFVSSSRDALLVNCKMSTGETCINPRPNLIHMNGLDREGEGHTWFSDMSNGHIVSLYMI